jgi:glutamate synthase (NADPH/NADH) large chain
MVGRCDLLRQRTDIDNWKAAKLDLSPIIAPVEAAAERDRFCRREFRQSLATHIDRELVRRAQPALEDGANVAIELSVRNTDRAVGAMLAGEVARGHGAAGLPDGTIEIIMRGSAGQSFGAFLTPGITLELEGDANDYVGKGLSGGRIVVYPPQDATFAWEDNVLVGNTVMYGATGGEMYLAGTAGERFAVRNSGARAVVEGVGEHGCEYMTGGVVVVLGRTGRNFAAGMSGGVAYVFERERTFRALCNTATVELETLADESEVWLVYGLIEEHVRYTGSPLGNRILDNWEAMIPHFVKVIPVDYKRVLQARRARRARDTGPRNRLAVISGGQGHG